MRGPLSIAACWLLLICGCKRDTAPPPLPAARTDVSLSVLVIEEPEIARSLERLRGDWAELSGGSLRVGEVSTEGFSADDSLSADIVIYPARYLAEFVERNRVRPLRSSVLEDEGVAFQDILPAIREGELAYGGEYYALPFGSHVLIHVGRDGEGGTATEGNGPGVLSPADGDTAAAPSDLPQDGFPAALVLLAHAAPQAMHPSQLAVLFHLESMKPQIDGEPFIAALQELVAEAAATGQGANSEGARWQWWPGTGAAAAPGGTGGGAGPLPVSDRVYNPIADRWEEVPGGESLVPLVGGKSHVGSVTAASRNAPAAFRLLAWLGGGAGERRGRVAVAPTRRGTSDGPIERAFSQSRYLQVPRILEVDSYLSALDTSVRRALSGDLSPRDALIEAAGRWDEITDRVGRPRQQEVYKRHLNLQ